MKNAANEPGTKSYDARVENGGSLLQALQLLEKDCKGFRYGIGLFNLLCYGNDSESEDFQSVTTPLICAYIFVIENLMVNHLHYILPTCALESLMQHFCSFVTLCCICSFKTTQTPRIAPYLVEVNNVSKGPDTFWDAFLFNEQTKDVIPIREYKTGEMVTLPKIKTNIVIYMFFFCRGINFLVNSVETNSRIWKLQQYTIMLFL